MRQPNPNKPHIELRRIEGRVTSFTNMNKRGERAWITTLAWIDPIRPAITRWWDGCGTDPYCPDQYGNSEAEPNKYCCFPDCGCDGARNCDAESGAHSGALTLNRERTS